MKYIKLFATLGIIAALALWTSPTIAQQYIMEQLLEEQSREDSPKSEDIRDHSRENESAEPSLHKDLEIDPRLTPEYWGIEEDTII